jgi:hypothetical protein
MPNFNLKISDGNRDEIIQYIQQKKQLGSFKVIDVGGSVSGWSADYIDAIADFNEPSIAKDNIKFFKLDITSFTNWIELKEYVARNGLFDFCICTHTLEDIMNPVFVAEQISLISKAGYISFPSKYREMSRIEGNYRGYIHHRWIFDVGTADNVIIAYPKINYIENEGKFDKIANSSHDKYDFSFYWQNSIDIKYVNNNYLGPDDNSVKNYYDMLLNC